VSGFGTDAAALTLGGFGSGVLAATRSIRFGPSTFWVEFETTNPPANPSVMAAHTVPTPAKYEVVLNGIADLQVRQTTCRIRQMFQFISNLNGMRATPSSGWWRSAVTARDLRGETAGSLRDCNVFRQRWRDIRPDRDPVGATAEEAVTRFFNFKASIF
jgi:hypothetical protein